MEVMRIAVLICALAFAVVSSAENPPQAFSLSDVVITLKDSPRWPVGEAVVITISESGSFIARTRLPCEKCEEVRTRVSIEEDQILKLLNHALRDRFFDLTPRYDEAPMFYRGADAKIHLGRVVTTDEDVHTITIKIGAWTKVVVDEGEAPAAFKTFADAIRQAVGFW